MSSEENERDVLSEQIKQHHKILRQKYMETRDAESVWRENCEDVKTLQEYAAAMRLLAERHWEHSFNTNPLCSRISWCVQACNQYFRGGDLQKAVDKDARREQFQKHGSTADEDGGTPRKRISVDVEDDLLVLDVGSCYNPFSNVPGWTVVALDIAPAVSSVFQADFLSLLMKDNDCLPEFHAFISSSTKKLQETSSSRETIDAIRSSEEMGPIDEGCSVKVSGENEIMQQSLNKHPSKDKAKVAAEKSVNEDDTLTQDQVPMESKADVSFLEMQTSLKNEDRPPAETSSDSKLQKSPKNEEINYQRLQWLPRNSFRIVIFCLVLGYMPCPGMRFRCCKQAYDVLKHNGVLLIITPDSKHVGANARVMKQWQITLGWVGFIRVRYDKLPHLHCMMFRKTPNAQLAHVEAQRLVLKQLKTHSMPPDYVKPQQLFIHQDSQFSEKNRLINTDTL